MNIEEQSSSTRWAALGDLRTLLELVPASRRTILILVTLGLAASLAETIGISLVILFVYAAMGRIGSDGELGQMFGPVADWALQLTGGQTQLALVILALIVARGILSYTYNRMSAALGACLSEAARNGIHGQYLAVSYEFFRSREQAELLDVLGTDSWAVSQVNNAFTRVLISVCAIIVFTGFLLALSWQISLVAAACFIVASLVLGRFSQRFTDLGASVKAEHQSMGAWMLMTLQGMRVIRAFGREPFQHDRFLSSSAQARASLTRLDRLTAAIGPMTEIAYLTILCFIVAAGPAFDTDFHTTLAIVALLYRLQPHIRELQGNMLYLSQSAPQLASVRAMLDETDKDYPQAGSLPMPDSPAAIRFQRVGFAYDGKAALDDVSFAIELGSTTALLGPSGSGKTTIVSLLLRLYEPEVGQILVGDVPLSRISRADWLGRAAVAGQDVDLVEGTIRDNVLMARPEADEAMLEEAYAVSGLQEVLAGLDEGDEAWVGQQGLNLSGGQRQRVGIARAILRDPDFLILDEATSAMDLEMDKRIRAAIAQRFEGRTILIITHREETIRDVDHIVRLRAGTVADQSSAKGGA